jgi:hypothetical protein
VAKSPSGLPKIAQNVPKLIFQMGSEELDILKFGKLVIDICYICMYMWPIFLLK